MSYDRRGRGASGDGHPESADAAREVEDIAALIDAAGGRAVLFGTSSGAALALEAAARLGDRVSGLVAYEPPFICDDSRPPLAPDLPARIAASVADGDRSAAVKAFFVEAIGAAALRRRHHADAAAVAPTRRRSPTRSATTSRCSTARSRAGRCPSNGGPGSPRRRS